MTADYGTSDTQITDVKIIYSDEPTPYREQALRSPAQKHTDFALQSALDLQDEALRASQGALDWLGSVGADTPARFKSLPVVLAQLGRFIEDEQGRRG